MYFEITQLQLTLCIHPLCNIKSFPSGTSNQSCSNKVGLQTAVSVTDVKIPASLRLYQQSVTAQYFLIFPPPPHLESMNNLGVIPGARSYLEISQERGHLLA